MQTGRANPPVASIPQTPELVPVTTLPPRGTSDGKRGWGRRLLLADILWKDSNGNPRRGLHSECPTKQAGLCQEGEEIAPGDGRTIETAHFDLPGVQLGNMILRFFQTSWIVGRSPVCHRGYNDMIFAKSYPDLFVCCSINQDGMGKLFVGIFFLKKILG